MYSYIHSYIRTCWLTYIHTTYIHTYRHIPHEDSEEDAVRDWVSRSLALIYSGLREMLDSTYMNKDTVSLRSRLVLACVVKV